MNQIAQSLPEVNKPNTEFAKVYFIGEDPASGPVAESHQFITQGWIAKMKANFGKSHWLSDPDRKQRGTVKTFSSHSRARMIQCLNTIDYLEMGIPVMFTLTYPAEWPVNFNEWKRHLNRFNLRAKQMMEGFCGVWRLEPQYRGAPHYSFMVWGADFLMTKEGKEWLSKTWFEVVGSGDEKHLRAGTRVEGEITLEKVKWYIMKYQTKSRKGVKNEFFDYEVGRYWGKIYRDQMQYADMDTRTVSETTFIQLRRLFRKLMESKRRRSRRKFHGEFKTKQRGGGLWVILSESTVYKLREFYRE